MEGSDDSRVKQVYSQRQHLATSIYKLPVIGTSVRKSVVHLFTEKKCRPRMQINEKSLLVRVKMPSKNVSHLQGKAVMQTTKSSLCLDSLEICRSWSITSASPHGQPRNPSRAIPRALFCVKELSFQTAIAISASITYTQTHTLKASP